MIFKLADANIRKCLNWMLSHFQLMPEGEIRVGGTFLQRSWAQGKGRPKAGHKGRPAATDRESEEISGNMKHCVIISRSTNSKETLFQTNIILKTIIFMFLNI